MGILGEGLWPSRAISLDETDDSAAGIRRQRGKPGWFASRLASRTTRRSRRTGMNWKGVMPAITTCFRADLTVDHDFMVTHCRWLLDNGCTGIVALGSLGEG